MSDSEPSVTEQITEFGRQAEELDQQYAIAGQPLLVGEATVRLVATVPSQNPPLTPQEAVKAFVLDYAEQGADAFVFVVQDEKTEYLVNRDAILDDEGEDASTDD